MPSAPTADGTRRRSPRPWCRGGRTSGASWLRFGALRALGYRARVEPSAGDRCRTRRGGAPECARLASYPLRELPDRVVSPASSPAPRPGRGAPSRGGDDPADEGSPPAGSTACGIRGEAARPRARPGRGRRLGLRRARTHLRGALAADHVPRSAHRVSPRRRRRDLRHRDLRGPARVLPLLAILGRTALAQHRDAGARRARTDMHRAPAAPRAGRGDPARPGLLPAEDLDRFAGSREPGRRGGRLRRPWR
jgi:hypothetical protein